MQSMQINKSPAPSSTKTTPGGRQVNVFDANYEYLPMMDADFLAGVCLHIPAGSTAADWKGMLKNAGITQDPVTALLSVPLDQLPVECKQYDTDGDGRVACVIFPDDAAIVGEIHMIAGVQKKLEAIQRSINNDGLTILLDS